MTCNTPYFRVLSDDQIYEIKRAAFEILSRTGYKVLHGGAKDLLKKAGAIVKGDIVKVPEFIVQEALRTAPKGFSLYDRHGRRVMEVEGTKTYYGTSTASPNTKDALTGEMHETRVIDIARGAKVADALPYIDWVMPMGSSQDVPALAADLYEFEAVVTNTTKPIVFIGYSPKGVEMVYEMAAEVAGGLDQLQEKPFVVLYPEPITPLVMPPEVAERILITAKLGLPQIPGPSMMMGATAPVTIAGAVALLTAEALMSLTLVQLCRPGAACLLSGNIGAMNMRTGLSGGGGPERSLAIAAQAEVARSFGLPTWGLAGTTASKVLDAQAGIEATFHILAQALAGLNLIHDVGYMDQSMVCSTEMLVMGNEIISMVDQFMQGVEVNAETLARDLIHRVGPGGHFLDREHTAKHFKAHLWEPDLSTRLTYNAWKADGSKDMAQRVQERVRLILETHKVPELPGKVLSSIENIRKKGEEALA